MCAIWQHVRDAPRRAWLVRPTVCTPHRPHAVRVGLGPGGAARLGRGVADCDEANDH
jgi:hypothetical protein